MNKRLKRKLHKEYLLSIVYAISTSSYWRKLLLESGSIQTYEINSNRINEIESYTANLIRKYNLKYCVSVIKESDSVEFQSIVFKFWAKEFPKLEAESYNNPEVI